MNRKSNLHSYASSLAPTAQSKSQFSRNENSVGSGIKPQGKNKESEIITRGKLNQYRAFSLYWFERIN